MNEEISLMNMLITQYYKMAGGMVAMEAITTTEKKVLITTSPKINVEDLDNPSEEIQKEIEKIVEDYESKLLYILENHPERLQTTINDIVDKLLKGIKEECE